MVGMYTELYFFGILLELIQKASLFRATDLCPMILRFTFECYICFTVYWLLSSCGLNAITTPFAKCMVALNIRFPRLGVYEASNTNHVSTFYRFLKRSRCVCFEHGVGKVNSHWFPVKYIRTKIRVKVF